MTESETQFTEIAMMIRNVGDVLLVSTGRPLDDSQEWLSRCRRDGVFGTDDQLLLFFRNVCEAAGLGTAHVPRLHVPE